MTDHDPIDVLADMPERDLPGDRHRQIREFVMEQIEQRPVRRTATRRWVIAGAALAAVAVVAVGVGTLGTGAEQPAEKPAAAEAAPMSEVAHQFELAAKYALATPFTVPRPDQWVYMKTKWDTSGPIATSKGMKPQREDQSWYKADGTRAAYAVNGEKPSVTPVRDDEKYANYSQLMNLPTDPQALLDRLRAEIMGGYEGTPFAAGDPDEMAYGQIAFVLTNYVTPPDVTAALLRAAALIPNVSLSEQPVEIDGKRVIALGHVLEGFLLRQVLVDPTTHAVVGLREEIAEDHVMDADGEPLQLKKGQVESIGTRVSWGVVDKVGDTV